MVFPDVPANSADDGSVLIYPRRKVEPIVPLKAYVDRPSQRALKIAHEFRTRNENKHLSISELIAFLFDDAYQLLELERETICVRDFGYPAVQHNLLLIEFYTGLPDATQFCYVSSLLKNTIYGDYSTWDSAEKRGFLTHSLMALMKLRLGMPDEELAERFQVEPYVVNMTLRLWVPALCKHIYKAFEDMYRNHVDGVTKIVDIVEVCRETPDYNRRIGRNQLARRAVISVRSDAYVCFASDIFSDFVPGDACIQMSKFHHTANYFDHIRSRPELKHALMSIGIISRPMTEEADAILANTLNNIAAFKILSAIPEEYIDLASDIFKVCAVLTNFLVPLD